MQQYYTINEDAARHANTLNSFSDYKPGSATAEYRKCVDEAVEIAERQKKRVDPQYHEKIDYLLDLYARKLAENMNQGYAIEGRVPSVLIAGPANFPVRKKEKQNAARDKNMQDWQRIQGLLDKIRSVGTGGVSSDDADAVQKLQNKLDSRQRLQDHMKAVNAYYRKHKTLEGCPDLTLEQIEKLQTAMAEDRLRDRPYLSWQLSNNSAEMRRLKARIETLNRQRETEYVGWQFDGGRVEINREANRLQIFFDAKPDADTRSVLKSNAFHWSPREGAWQRQLSDSVFWAVDRMACIKPLGGEKPSDLQRMENAPTGESA